MAHPQPVFVLEDEEEEFLFLGVWQECSVALSPLWFYYFV